MTNYIAAISAVKVSSGSPNGNSIVRIVREGEVIPEGVDESVIDSLLARGLISELDEPAEDKSGDPYKGWKVDDFRSEIEKRNADREDDKKIVPAEPGNKPEMLAALQADDAKQSQQ